MKPRGIKRYHYLELGTGKTVALGKTITECEEQNYALKQCLVLDYSKRRWARSWHVQPFAWNYKWNNAKDVLYKGA